VVGKDGERGKFPDVGRPEFLESRVEGGIESGLEGGVESGAEEGGAEKSAEAWKGVGFWGIVQKDSMVNLVFWYTAENDT
jgi:hypothetical protein